MNLFQKISVLIILILVSACTSTPYSFSGLPKFGTQERARLTSVQECAIGFDMANQIYQQLDVTKATIRISKKSWPCAEQGARYLRQAGFQVDETNSSKKSNLFSISTYEDYETEIVFATATIGNLRFSRGYKRSDTGMFGVTPMDVGSKEIKYEPI